VDADAAELAAWQRRLEPLVAAGESGGDGSHDATHVRRVYRTASRLAAALDEPVDRLVLLAAAYLHDVVPIEKNDPRRAQASRLSAARALELLAELDFPADRRTAVAHAIEAHSFSAGIPPRTTEARVLQDADRLEALGAIGLARTFYVAGRMGSALFDADDPLGRTRALDDRRWALDHFQTKLYGLPDTMTTAPGRRLARERAAVLERFVQDLLDEL
jgi:uncharacterized protein